VNRPFLSRSGRLGTAILFFTSALGLTACGENIFEQKWTSATVDTVLIYSVDRPEINLPSGFDFVRRRPVRIQSPGVTGSWDLMLDTQNGDLVFLLPAAVDITSTTLVLPLPGMAFDDVLRAPKDTTLYTRDAPVSIDTGTVYVVRTRRGPDRFGLLCSFYAKFQPVVVDPTQETVQFAFDVNPICDDRSLVPTD
jgi:hypothetical protein